jgi:murein DD-endopeptidase MepM/ murein hydrolase activator NlpD
MAVNTPPATGNDDASPKDSDANYTTQADDQLTGAAKRMAGAYRKKAQSDANETVPAAQKDAQGNLISPVGPKVAKPLFACPLALGQGPGPNGPAGERCITSDFGESRNQTNEVGKRVGGRLHQGIDLRCPNGEIVYAMADGIVDFVGYSRKKGTSSSPARVGHPQVDWATGNIIDVDTGQVVARVGPPNELAYAGIYVSITHDGDFKGYRTSYMHLSDVLVRWKDAAGKQVRVKKGDKIGITGQTGGDNGRTGGPHLHLKVELNGIAINPAECFPNYKPNKRLVRVNGQIEGSSAAGALAQQNAKNPQPAGAAVVNNNLANQLQCQQREIECANMSSADMQEKQSDHANVIASNIDVHTMAVYKAVAEFQAKLPQIENPVYFDFDTGLWSDQTSPPASGTGL